MILLLGGTSETSFIAEALAGEGYKVLVSTATDIPLDIVSHPNISHRKGMLDVDRMAALVSEHGIRVIIDASHPYASNLHHNAEKLADTMGIPYLAWDRDRAVSADATVMFAPNHESAAVLAFSFGVPVLLTTGSRNLLQYAAESKRTSTRLVARVLDHPSSLEACLSAGISSEDVIAGRGPFTAEDNISVIRRFGIGVLVTKDSGNEGGVPAKLKAAEMENCRVIVIERPRETEKPLFNSIPPLLERLAETQCKQ